MWLLNIKQYVQSKAKQTLSDFLAATQTGCVMMTDSDSELCHAAHEVIVPTLDRAVIAE